MTTQTLERAEKLSAATAGAPVNPRFDAVMAFQANPATAAPVIRAPKPLRRDGLLVRLFRVIQALDGWVSGPSVCKRDRDYAETAKWEFEVRHGRCVELYGITFR